MLLIARLSQFAALSALLVASATSFANVPNPYGAIAYSPQDDVFVTCNDIDTNCHILRLRPSDALFAHGFE